MRVTESSARRLPFSVAVTVRAEQLEEEPSAGPRLPGGVGFQCTLQATRIWTGGGGEGERHFEGSPCSITAQCSGPTHFWLSLLRTLLRTLCLRKQDSWKLLGLTLHP